MRIPPTAELDAVDSLRPAEQVKCLPTPGEQLDLYYRYLAYGDEEDHNGRPPNPVADEP